MTRKPKTNQSEKLAAYIIEGIQEKKGISIVKVDLRDIQNAISDYFVICHGTSDRQVGAIADSVVDVVREKFGDKPNAIEGKQHGEWVLLDYVDVVVHIFQEKWRELYSLEDLWADAPIEQIGD